MSWTDDLSAASPRLGSTSQDGTRRHSSRHWSPDSEFGPRPTGQPRIHGMDKCRSECMFPPRKELSSVHVLRSGDHPQFVVEGVVSLGNEETPHCINAVRWGERTIIPRNFPNSSLSDCQRYPSPQRDTRIRISVERRASHLSRTHNTRHASRPASRRGGPCFWRTNRLCANPAKTGRLTPDRSPVPLRPRGLRHQFQRLSGFRTRFFLVFSWIGGVELTQIDQDESFLAW